MNGYLCTALDSAGTTCVQWVAVAGPFPALTVADAMTIGSCFVAAWAIAWTLRFVALQVFRSRS